MIGRKPVPSALRKLRGNPGGRPLNDSEPKPSLEVPACPGHLYGAAKNEFLRLVEELRACGILTEIDRSVLAAYCQVWARWCDAEAELRKTGLVIMSPNGYPIQSPYLSIANKSMQLMKGFLIELGMTPAARPRIQANPPSEPDPFLEFLTRGKPKPKIPSFK